MKKVKKTERNIILFVGDVFNINIDDVEDFERSQKRKFRTALLTSHNLDLNKKVKQKGVEKRLDFILRCDTKNIVEIKKVIMPIRNKVVVVFCYFESWMPLYARLVKLLPSVNMPTVKALKICNSKFEMRKRFKRYYPEISPKFMLINESQKAKEIAKKIGFPCITKPLNLTKSRLVIKSDNSEELKNNLKHSFKKIEKVYKKVNSESKPMILAEEYMEGDLYSIDAYINAKGKIYFTPIVRVVTGKDIGIDDFFNYYRLTPTNIGEKEEKKAQVVAKKSIKSTKPSAVTVHIELMRTKKGKWKIVELQTRPGGYRNEMLKLSFGIKHQENDFLNKMGKKLIIPKKIKSHTAVFEIFPEKEGKLVSIQGIEKLKKLKSFLRYNQIKKNGDDCGYSRDGHIYVLLIVLNSYNKNILYRDIEKIKDIIKIKVK
ncbi:MAG: ATP-grasp domain-containing protein [Candidatus Pacebacteria bacterium]|nr:ATP-grasp domain-containing protein [Candidatus Paceibacterota bacterium]